MTTPTATRNPAKIVLEEHDKETSDHAVIRMDETYAVIGPRSVIFNRQATIFTLSHDDLDSFIEAYQQFKQRNTEGDITQ